MEHLLLLFWSIELQAFEGAHRHERLGMVGRTLGLAWWILTTEAVRACSYVSRCRCLSASIQVCLAALMAQVGAWVPAHSLTLTPVDAIFVRMGAKDDVMSGQSTFFVELAETAAALNRATPASLVALDELGRGTATSDGAAIAAAVLEHLSVKTCCRSGS